MDRITLNRRKLLLGGAAALGVGRLLMPPTLYAAGPAPGRLLLFWTPCGSWTPLMAVGGETDFALGRVTESLAPLKSKMLLVRDLDRVTIGSSTANFHLDGCISCWSGVNQKGPKADGPSIDQLIKSKINPPTPEGSVQLGVNCRENSVARGERMLFELDGTPIRPEADPRAVFDRLVAKYAGGAVTTPVMAPKMDNKRILVVDFVMEQIRALRNQHLGMEEKQKLDRHLEQMRDLQVSLRKAPVPAVATGKCTATAPVPGDSDPARLKAMFDLVNQIFTCDISRIASMQLAHGFSEIRYDWLSGKKQGAAWGSVHYLSKDTGNALKGTVSKQTEDYITCKAWEMEQLAYIGKLLDQGGILDSSAVVWGTELGNDGQAHSRDDHAFVVLGSANGYFKQGRNVSAGKVPINRFLLTLADAMGARPDVVGYRNLNTGGVLPALKA